MLTEENSKCALNIIEYLPQLECIMRLLWIIFRFEWHKTTMATFVSIWREIWCAKFNWKSHTNVHWIRMNVNSRCLVVPRVPGQSRSIRTHSPNKFEKKKKNIRPLIHIFESNKKSINEIIFQHQMNDERRIAKRNEAFKMFGKRERKCAPQTRLKTVFEWNHPVLSNSFEIAIDN